MSTREPAIGSATVGLLHPGAMGAAVGRVLSDLGHTVLWCDAGRSDATIARAGEARFHPMPSLEELTAASDVVLSVVPPHAAAEVAAAVAGCGFTGTYLDANAVSPDRSRSIEAIVTPAGASYVDGGIVGGPPRRPGTTWLHLSGPAAVAVAALFEGGPLAANVVSRRIGDASAVKVAFAAWTKGSTALRTAVLAYAETAGVARELEAQWEALQPGFWSEGRERAVSVTAKAWRFEGEMHEIADALRSVGLPDGFHLAAAETYRRIGPLRDDAGVDVDAVVHAMRGASALVGGSGSHPGKPSTDGDGDDGDERGA